MSETKSAPASPSTLRSSPATEDGPPPKLNGKQLAKLNSPLFLWPATLVLAALLFLGLGYLVDALTHESTDDAFIAAHVVSVAPRISGQVASVHVLDNQMVRSNDLLMEIDPANYAITVAQKQSSSSASEANYKAALAALELMAVKVTTAEANADQSKADISAAEATDARAQADFQRMVELRKQNAISAQEFDAAQAAVREADANLAAVKLKAVADASRINEAKATQTATESTVGMALATFRQTQTAVESAQLDLSYTKIFAPCDGRITRKSVEPGVYVQTGQQFCPSCRRTSGSSPISRNRS